MSFRSEKFTQDNYMRPDEIDARNAPRLLKILDDWEAGKYASLWHILHDVYEIMFIVNPLHYQNLAGEWALEKIAQEQKDFIPYIKPVFLENPNSSEVRLALKEFKRHLDNTDGSLTSFAIAALIFDSVSVDGDGGKNPEGFSKLSPAIQRNFGTWATWAKRQPNPFHGVIATLKIQEHHFKNPPKEVDLFHYDGPEPESAFRKRLETYIDELRAWRLEQGITGLIIGNITADASGSAAFRPHVFNYNFMRDCPEKDALFESEAENPSDFLEDRFFDFRVKEFNPDHSFHKEDIYPYPVVYVTTYAITFFPQHGDDIEQLKALLKKAFEILGMEVEQRFGNPIRYSSATKYECPNPSWISAKDGSFAIKERVDLDDLYNLYYLLEDVIVPSATIARTMNAATLLEARSPIKTYDVLSYSDEYSVENSSQIDQIGMITKYGPSPLEQGLKDLFELYALENVDEKGLVQQTMNLADMALMGQITNQSKTLLSYDGMKEIAESKGHAIVPYDIAITDLTKVFMKAMAGIAPNVPIESIGNMIFQAVAGQRDTIVAKLQEHDKKDWDRIWDHVGNQGRGVNLEDASDILARFEKALTISDALSGYNPNFYKGKKDERAKAIAPSSAYRLVIRDPDIEPCIARNFDGTPYTSRMSGDPFPRLELPERLQSFLAPEHKPVAQQALLNFQLS